MSAICAFASTWTFHGFQGNQVAIIITDNLSDPYSGTMFGFYWDKGDPDGEGGIYPRYPSGWADPIVTGYHDVLSLDTQLGFCIWTVDISGPWPDFNGLNSVTSPGICDGGEFWIDFSASGTVRISATQPVDFGKWAWDGLINPSWVAAKKGFAKGHNKQPLPTTK